MICSPGADDLGAPMKKMLSGQHPPLPRKILASPGVPGLAGTACPDRFITRGQLPPDSQPRVCGYLGPARCLSVIIVGRVERTWYHRQNRCPDKLPASLVILGPSSLLPRISPPECRSQRTRNTQTTQITEKR